MGSPKALLTVGDGRTFVEAVTTTLLAGGCAGVFAVVGDDPEIAEAARATEATVLINPQPGEGPITSLRLAIEALPSEAVGLLYHPVDHPFVSVSTVRTLLEEAERGAKLVVPMLGGDRGHPAFFGRALFSDFLDPALEGGARTVVHAHLATAVLPQVADTGIRADLDTPEQYEAAMHRFAR